MQSNTDSVQEKINIHLLRLSKNEVYGLPSWELLYGVVQELKYNFSVDRSKYVRQLYSAIKDLFTLDYNEVVEVVGIDEATHSITFVGTRHYANRVGLEKMPPIIYEVEKHLFKAAYAGKTLEQVNQNPVCWKSNKLNKYAKRRSLTASLEDEDDGSFDSIQSVVLRMMDGDVGFEQKIDRLFKPVIDTEWPTLTFEQFVNKYSQDTVESKSEKALLKIKDKPLVYTSFTELFINPKDIDPCVKVLENYEKSRDRKLQFRKCVIIAWINYLHNIGKIRTNDFKLLGPVLAVEFSGLTIAVRTTYDYRVCAEEAKKHFTMNIPRNPR